MATSTLRRFRFFSHVHGQNDETFVTRIDSTHPLDALTQFRQERGQFHVVEEMSEVFPDGSQKRITMGDLD